MDRIFLIGYMGSGKTTFGRLIAKSQNLMFLDLDTFIEEKYLKSVSELFDEVGESEFRKMERDALREVCRFENCLIATGGGTPCFFVQYGIDEQGWRDHLSENFHRRTGRPS